MARGDVMKSGKELVYTVNRFTNGANYQMWSDRKAGTIVYQSVDKKTIGWSQDNAVRTDSNGMSDCQSWSYIADPNAPVRVFTLRKDGTYVEKGQPLRGSSRLYPGERSEYYDFSF